MNKTASSAGLDHLIDRLPKERIPVASLCGRHVCRQLTKVLKPIRLGFSQLPDST